MNIVNIQEKIISKIRMIHSKTVDGGTVELTILKATRVKHVDANVQIASATKNTNLSVLLGLLTSPPVILVVVI